MFGKPVRKTICGWENVIIASTGSVIIYCDIPKACKESEKVLDFFQDPQGCSKEISKDLNKASCFDLSSSFKIF